MFLWQPAGGETGECDAWLGTLAPWLQGRPATLLCTAGTAPGAELLHRMPALRMLECSQSNPAQVWNLALAAAAAPVVLLLAAGAVPQDDVPARVIAELGDEPVALAQPVLAGDGLADSLGLEEVADLRMQRRPATEDDRADLAFVAPEAFYVSRAAFTRLGPFDEDLYGTGALVELCLRARHHGFRLLGLRDVRVGIGTAADMLEQQPPLERDRLVILARHRPDELFGALASFRMFWELPAEELRSLILALCRRMPGPMPENAVELLAASATALVGRTAPRAELDAARRRLDELSAELAAERRRAADEQGRLQGELSASSATFEQCRTELEAELEESRARAAELEERAAGARAALARREDLLAEIAARAGLDAAVPAEECADAVGTLRGDRERLEAEVRSLHAELEDRARWIVRLLEEKARRRLALFPPRFPGADAVIAPSRFVADMFEANGFAAERLLHIPYGVDASRIAGLRTRTPDGMLSIGFIGSLAAHKGLHVLIEALRGIDGDHWRLHVHGSVDTHPSYAERLCTLAGGDPRIEFHGAFRPSGLGEVLAGVDVVAVPSLWYENTPFTVLEALAAGRPVIASDTGGISEVVRDGHNGFLAAPGRPGELRAVVQRLLDEPERLRDAATHCAAVRDVDANVDDFLGIYRRLAGVRMQAREGVR